jgi:hypothetical protein
MIVAFDYDAEAFNDIIMQYIIPLITEGHSKRVFFNLKKAISIAVVGLLQVSIEVSK